MDLFWSRKRKTSMSLFPIQPWRRKIRKEKGTCFVPWKRAFNMIDGAYAVKRKKGQKKHRA